MKTRKPLFFSCLMIFFLIVQFWPLEATRPVEASRPPYQSPWWQVFNRFWELKNKGKNEELLEFCQERLDKAVREGEVIRQIIWNVWTAEVYLDNVKDYSKGVEYGKKALDMIYEIEVSDLVNEPDESFYPWSLGRGDDWSKENWFKEIRQEINNRLYYGALYSDDRHKEFVDLGVWELEKARAKQDTYRFIEVGASIANVCQYQLKDYSRAIKYGQEAYDLLEECSAEGAENLPDEWFFSQIKRLEATRGNDFPRELLREEKVQWYQNTKMLLLGILSQAYGYVGNNKKSELYRRELLRTQPTQEESWEQVKTAYRESLEGLKQSLREVQKARAKYIKEQGDDYFGYAQSEETLKEQIAQLEKQLGSVYEKIESVKSDEEDIYTRMMRQRAEGDKEALRESLKEFEKQLYNEYYYDQDREKPYGPDYVKSLVYPSIADTAYQNGLYQEAYEYALKAIEAHERFLPQYRQWLVDDGKKRAREQVEYYRGEKEKALKKYGRQTAASYDQIIEGQEWKGLSEGEEAMLESRRLAFSYPAVWLKAGMSLRQMGKYRKAIEYLEKAYRYEVEESPHALLWESVNLEGLPVRMEALKELSLAYEEAGMTRKCIEALAEFIDYLEEMRARLTLSGQRMGYLSKHNDSYDRIISLLVSDRCPDEALSYAERSKSRSFVDLLGGKVLRPKNEKMQQLVNEKNSMEARYADLVSQDSGDAASRHRSIKIVKKEIDDVMAELAREDAEFMSMTSVKTLPAGEIPSLLDADTVLVEYYVTREALFVWVVSEDSVKVKKIDVPVWVLARKIAALRQAISSPLAGAVVKETFYEPSSVRLQITPQDFTNGDEYTMRVYVKNNMSLFLTIDQMEYKVGEMFYPESGLLEKEVPPGEEEVVVEKVIKWKISPGREQVILKTDQGTLMSNILEIGIDRGSVSVKDRGGSGYLDDVQKDVEKYDQMSLYHILISPIKPYLDKKRVCIVAHGVLHYLPFAALQDKGKYLIQDYALVYLPSATIYKFCKDKIKQGGEKVLALGNPDVKNPELDLPYALQEVESISSIYPSSKVLARREASETAFKSMASSYDIIHLACHGIFDADNPMDSFLLLSPSGREDGKLTMSEIFDLEFNAGLVTLSACQSGMLRITSGDELMGFPRAFVYAGAPSVVASLWNVNDEATADLMKRFYENLKGMDKAEALRLAQIELLQNPRYSNPYYWAAFYLIGDYRQEQKKQ